jgi:uncharacterized membrane protein HdeD (DUF308 family)
MAPIRKPQLRGPGVVFLIVGIVFLGVGVIAGQTTFLTMGPSMVAIGIAFIASARRRPS